MTIDTIRDTLAEPITIGLIENFWPGFPEEVSGFTWDDNDTWDDTDTWEE